MPRKDFRKHLEQVKERPLPSNILKFREGEDDGTFTFVFKPPKLQQGITIQASISDVGDYPRAHSFFIFVVSDDVPEKIGSAIADVGTVDEMAIDNLVKLLANKLNACLNDSQREDVEMLEASDQDWDELQDPPEEDDDGYDGGYSDDDESFGILSASKSHATKSPVASKASAIPINMSEQEVGAFKRRVRADLEEVKKAGFRFAHQGLLLQPGQKCYVMVSCRVAKLGIPEDAMKAWYLNRDEYIMLILHYPNGYSTCEEIVASGRNNRSTINMHIVVTQRYKLSLAELIQTFTQVESKNEGLVEPTTKEDFVRQGIRPLFMGAALDDLMNSRLATLISYRQGRYISWSGAEQFYNDHQGRVAEVSSSQGAYHGHTDYPPGQRLPSLIASDHLAERASDFSFPVLAMQFGLLHIVRCTEFCLVCWCKTGDEFEALKPYVCSRPLCLFQYMTMGFGPSIEFEILTQPYVVDLLVSFCYISAQSRILKDFPIGLGISVPNPSLMTSTIEPYPGSYEAYHGSTYKPSTTLGHGESGQTSGTSKKYSSKILKASWHEDQKEFVLQDSNTMSVKAGDWICFWAKDGVKHHCKITEAWYPKIRYGSIIDEITIPVGEQADNGAVDALAHRNLPGLIRPQTVPKPSLTPPKSGESSKQGAPKVSIAVYDCSFDDLTDGEKHSSLVLLLKTLPSVTDMREYLQSKRKQGTLVSWTEKITPAALSVLRWIIASNRSCIIQPQNLSGNHVTDEEQVFGMDGYIQFRFASGAPDKESRFIQCMRETKQRLNLKFPTIFAWHGSPLVNWHGIVREGLNYDRISHGRAFGNGVYHSLHAGTSLGYSQMYTGYHSSPTPYWPSSKLQATAAIALNEIINSPSEFISKTPHLVVDKTDWIQNRYLFVKCNKAGWSSSNASKPTQILEQDPSMIPVGPTNNQVVLPITAISKSRRPWSKSIKLGQDGNKRSRVSVDSGMSEELEMDLVLSERSDDEDLKLLAIDLMGEDSDPTGRGKSLAKKSSKKKVTDPMTPFTPGNLDRKTLPILAPPSYATSQATKALQREIKTLLKAQEIIPQEELGWYLDAEAIENPYQLIVEMHSFDQKLPLARDMMSFKINSIVFELRFGQSFPFSPPFIRVIRPRFLPLMAGGGGHVTQGGAICMELLTNSGWNPSSSLEAILLQVRMAITSTDPHPAKLDRHGALNDYNVGEAVEAYKRACMTHGVSSRAQVVQGNCTLTNFSFQWQIPSDFQAMSMAGAGGSGSNNAEFGGLPPIYRPIAPAPASKPLPSLPGFSKPS